MTLKLSYSNDEEHKSSTIEKSHRSIINASPSRKERNVSEFEKFVSPNSNPKPTVNASSSSQLTSQRSQSEEDFLKLTPYVKLTDEEVRHYIATWNMIHYGTRTSRAAYVLCILEEHTEQEIEPDHIPDDYEDFDEYENNYAHMFGQANIDSDDDKDEDNDEKKA